MCSFFSYNKVKESRIHDMLKDLSHMLKIDVRAAYRITEKVKKNHLKKEKKIQRAERSLSRRILLQVSSRF